MTVKDEEILYMLLQRFLEDFKFDITEWVNYIEGWLDYFEKLGFTLNI